MVQTSAKRLTKSDWLSAGFKALTDAGPDMLKAEPLARRLGTTKGSFYWHFTDVPAYHDALLAACEVQAVADVMAVIGTENSAVARLRRMGQVISETSARRQVDPAVRAWACGNKRAAQAVARVDAKRLAYIHELLSELDIANPEIARIIYAASVGMETMGGAAPAENAEAMGTLVDLVLALR